MPNIQKIKLESISVKGLKTRTNNANEMNENTQKIAPLWQRFYDEVLTDANKNARLYGVYYHYESDAMGEFDVLVGTDELNFKDEVASVELEAGDYLMFPVKGELPYAIVETWKKVWAYFDDPSIDERRVYGTDFEKYISKDEAEIYVGVHYF